MRKTQLRTCERNSGSDVAQTAFFRYAPREYRKRIGFRVSRAVPGSGLITRRMDSRCEASSVHQLAQ